MFLDRRVLLVEDPLVKKLSCWPLIKDIVDEVVELPTHRYDFRFCSERLLILIPRHVNHFIAFNYRPMPRSDLERVLILDSHTETEVRIRQAEGMDLAYMVLGYANELAKEGISADIIIAPKDAAMAGAKPSMAYAEIRNELVRFFGLRPGMTIRYGGNQANIDLVLPVFAGYSSGYDHYSVDLDSFKEFLLNMYHSKLSLSDPVVKALASANKCAQILSIAGVEDDPNVFESYLQMLSTSRLCLHCKRATSYHSGNLRAADLSHVRKSYLIHLASEEGLCPTAREYAYLFPS